MKREIAIFLAAITWIVLPIASGAQPRSASQRIHRVARVWNLTGLWKGNDGGTYEIRQVGNQVWWYGRSANGGRSWQNVFNGTITVKGEINGNWSDLLSGITRGSGRLILRIQNQGRLTSIYRSGGFGGSEWVRSARQVVVRDHRHAQVIVRDHRPGQGGSTVPPPPARSSPCSADLSRALRGMKANIPQLGKGKADAGIDLPDNVNQWFTETAGSLEGVMRRLAGNGAVNEYIKWERGHGIDTDVKRVEMRVRAISRIVQ